MSIKNNLRKQEYLNLIYLNDHWIEEIYICSYRNCDTDIYTTIKQEWLFNARSMKLFYGEIEGNRVTINNEEQQHIVKVLRMKEGEEIHITDGKGNLASGRLMIEGKKAAISIDEIKTGLPDFHPQLHIAIAPTKNIDRIEFLQRKP